MTTMLLIGMLMAGGLMQKNQPMPQPGAASPEQQAKAIYTGFLEGNGVQLDEEQAAMWWVPNFQGSELRYEWI